MAAETPFSPFHASHHSARLQLLRAFHAISLGAQVKRTAAGKCVAALLGDHHGRLSVFGGREGMPRSLGSVLGGSVVRFLGGFAGIESRSIPAGVQSRPVSKLFRHIKFDCSGIAVSRDGSTLLLADFDGGSHALHLFSVKTGVYLRSIGSLGDGPLQFKYPCQVYVSCDDFVFVADNYNHRIQVLTPQLTFHDFVGVGNLWTPAGVCADAAVIAVSEVSEDRISVFNRGDGALLRRFGRFGRRHGQLMSPLGLCLMSGNRHIAVADFWNNRISVFSLSGDFVRVLGRDKLSHPSGVTCSDSGDELVIADSFWNRIVVLSASGDVLKTVKGDKLMATAIHGDTIFAQTDGSMCAVLT